MLLVPPFFPLRVMKEKFYEKALPSQGVYCVTGIKDKKVQNRFASTLAELFHIIDEQYKGDKNVFVAMNTYKGYSRKAEDAQFARSFFLDLDVDWEKKGDPRKYPDKASALSSLNAFIATGVLPPPVVIDSGTGIHAYWLFNEDIPSRVWKVYAEKFKTFCMSKLLIDPVVTADAARIMRCPETLNHKTEPPTPTRFLTTQFWTYDFEAFTDFLGTEDIAPDPQSLFATIEKGLNKDLGDLDEEDPHEADFAELAQKSVDDDGGCVQLKHMLFNVDKLSEPLWRAQLSIVRYCLDWETNIHEVSEGHPKYSKAETEAKTAALLNNRGKVKVYTCATIEDLNPGGCDKCPYRGKIGNPTHIVRRLRQPTSPSQDAIRSDEDPEEVPVYTTYPQELAPFKRGPNGGVWYTPPAKKDKDGNWIPQKDIQLWKYDLYPIKRMYDADNGDCFLMRHIMPHDGIRDFLLPSKSVYATDKFKESCTSHGVYFNPDNTPLMVKYVVKWGEVMVSFKQAERTRRQMGWTEDYKGFVVGDREYRENHTVAKTAASSMVIRVASLMQQVGSYDLWREAAQKLNRPGYEMHAFVMFCGFGSPLLRHTAYKGVVLGLIGRTGAAKSGALYSAASMWGEPYQLCLSGAKKGATENALIQWMMGLKNIVFGLDEASNYESKDISDLLYRATQGKNKVRMSASDNSVRPIELMASLITILTSNQSMTDKMLQDKGNPDGELARYAEFTISKPSTMTNTEGTEIFDVFRNNYGWAGPVFIQFVFRKGEGYVAEKIKKWAVRFANDAGDFTDYRFLGALVSVAFAGAELAAEAGIVSCDLERIYGVVMKQVRALGEDNRTKADYEALLGEFQREHINGTLLVREGSVIREPKGNLVARVEMESRMYYVSTTALMHFLAKYKIDRKDFANNMRAKNLLVYEDKKKLATGWAGFSAMSSVATFGFKNVIPDELFQSTGNE